jgi:hypothetical protein
VAGSAYVNFRQVDPGLEDISGDSVFFKDDAGQVFHTYSSYGRGGAAFLGNYRFLDRMPKGREENGPTHRTAWSKGMADFMRPPAPARSISERFRDQGQARRLGETVLDMHSKIARNHDDNDDYADDVENIHSLAPV